MLNNLKQRHSRVFENSIGIRLLRYVFGCYLIVTIIVTCIQLIAEYSHVKKGVFEELISLEHTFKHSFGESLWTFDIKQLESILKGMSEIDVVVGIKILGHKGELISSIGITKEIEEQINNTPSVINIPLNQQNTTFTDSLYEYSFPITYLDKNLNAEQIIGYGKIYSNDAIVVNRVKYGFILIIINSVIKTSALWFIFFYFTRKVLAIPLNTLTKKTIDLTQSQQKENTLIPSRPEFKDELACLTCHFNNMRQTILDKIDIIESNNESLEQRVAKRTAELKILNADLTKTLEELKKTQEKLIQSEKLSALGSLVAGISHELNTPVGNGLTAISFLSEATHFIKKKLHKSITRTELEKYIDEMEEGTEIAGNSLEKASLLINNFKQISVDRSTSQRREFLLNDILEDTHRTLISLLKNTSNTNVIFDINIEDNIEMDSFPGAIEEIINSLVKNSISHGFKKRSCGKITLTVTVLGNTVTFVYSDDGVGINKENLKKIFDPFFTTTLGQGSNGLGLHIIHNIVTAILGGSINVLSMVGSYTKFTLTIPKVSPHDE